MKIATAPSIIALSTVRTATAKSLAAGESVFIEAASTAETAGMLPYTTDVKKQMVAGRAALAGVHLSDSVVRQLNIPGMAVGSVTGMFAGAAIGVILDQIKAVHPTSGVAFDAACALLGATTGTAVGSGLFKINPTWENGKFGMEVSPVVPK